MTDLTPEARELVQAGRQALRPTQADRERNLEALRARLGDAAFLGELLRQPASLVPSPKRGPWPTISAVTVGLAVVGGALFFGLRPKDTPAPTPPSVVPTPTASSVAPPEPVPAATAPTAPHDESPEPTRAVPRESSTPSAGRSRARLSEEVALLSRATAELRAGRATESLRVLDEHQTKFPNGVLTEERRAARAQALCALGRQSEAELELTRLARSAPQSALAARARQVCGR